MTRTTLFAGALLVVAAAAVSMPMATTNTCGQKCSGDGDCNGGGGCDMCFPGVGICYAP